MFRGGGGCRVGACTAHRSGQVGARGGVGADRGVGQRVVERARAHVAAVVIGGGCATSSLEQGGEKESGCREVATARSGGAQIYIRAGSPNEGARRTASDSEKGSAPLPQSSSVRSNTSGAAG